jgi:hypothetical protein
MNTTHTDIIIIEQGYLALALLSFVSQKPKAILF